MARLYERVIEDAKASSLVQKATERGGTRGVRVAQIENVVAQKY